METTLNGQRLSPRTHFAVWGGTALTMSSLAIVYALFRDV